MPGDLEARLERALDALPDPSLEATARARRAALGALPRERAPRRLLGVVAVAAAGAGLAALSLVGLRATGTIHVQVGTPARAEQQASPLPQRLVVPRHAAGIAVVADGKLSLATRRGMRIEGLPVSAAALSPHALYVAVGLGHSLVAMAPDRRLAWTHRTDGTVVAVAWAPDGLRVAYVVRVRGSYELHAIEGDGDHDQLLDADVRPVRPAWRADALALAYAGGGGRPVVYDLAHRSRSVVRDTRCGGSTTALAFASRGRRLAALTSNGLIVASGTRTSCSRVPPGSTLAWPSRLRAPLVLRADALAALPATPGAVVVRGAGASVELATAVERKLTPLARLADGRVQSLDVR